MGNSEKEAEFVVDYQIERMVVKGFGPLGMASLHSGAGGGGVGGIVLFVGGRESRG